MTQPEKDKYNILDKKENKQIFETNIDYRYLLFFLTSYAREEGVVKFLSQDSNYKIIRYKT